MLKQDMGNEKKDRRSELAKNLVWEYDITPEEIFSVISGKKEKAGSLSIYNLFGRAFRLLTWQDVVFLFGVNKITDLMNHDNEQMRRNVMPALRNDYDTISALLLGKPIPVSKRCTSGDQWKQRIVLSDRWNRTVKGLS